MEHSQIVAGVSRVLVSTAIKLLRDQGAQVLENGDKRLADFVKEETLDAVFRRLPEVEEQVRKLEEAGVPIRISDLAHVAGNYARAWSTAADAKKRKLLEDAFVKSFDRELYESGLLNALWERLDRVSYGDLSLLRALVSASDTDKPFSRHQTFDDTSLETFHGTNLVREGLAYGTVGKQARAGGDSLQATELGRRLYALAFVESAHVSA